MTNEELEAAIAAGKEAEAKLAKRKAEPDWEAWRPALEAFYVAGNYMGRAGMVLDNPDKDNIRGFIAAAPHFPITAMADAEIEELARDLSKSCVGETIGQFVEAVVRETLSRVRLEPRWPSEAYGKQHTDGSRSGGQAPTNAYQQGGDV
jgi:hypothetical protein